MASDKAWYNDMQYLYKRSFTELEHVFRVDFKKSKVYEAMVLELYENVIEYKFLHQAGLLHQWIKVDSKLLFS